MSDIAPFSYLRYDPDITGDPGRLLAPPYDVIDDDAAAALAAESPYQAARVESPAHGDTAAAAEIFREWLEAGALTGGEVGFALIRQRFEGPDGVRRTRTGVLCELGLAPFEDRDVLPHERTFEAPRRLRERLMADVGANVSPVFVVADDAKLSIDDFFSAVTDDDPDFTAADSDGVQTAVWFVADTALNELFAERMAGHKLLIADGHHRYTAALAHRAKVDASARLRVAGAQGASPAMVQRTRTSGVDGVLAVLANGPDPGVCVFPTHRIVRGIELSTLEDFAIGSGALDYRDYDDVDGALTALDALDEPGFVAYGKHTARLYKVQDPFDMELAAPDSCDDARRLDIVALHALVLDGGAIWGQRATRGVHYTRSVPEAIAAADAADDTVALLVRAPSVAQLFAVAETGEVLPEKTTYFYPKVPTGVAYRSLTD